MGNAERIVSENLGEGRAAACLREHASSLAKVAMALVGEQALVERALEQVAREAGRGSPPGDRASAETRAWLMGLVRAACAAESARARRTTARLVAPEPEGSPETRREAVADAVVGRRALARLKPTEREAVVLHLVGGLDARGVATACGVAEDVAKSRLASGLSQLLEEEGR